MLLRTIKLTFISLAALTLFACGEAEIGDACDTRGSEDECVDGGICDTPSDGDAICLAVCTDDSDCESTEACNGVSGSNKKACFPK